MHRAFLSIYFLDSQAHYYKYIELICKRKGKVVPVLNKAPYHEDVRESRGIAPPFLTSALDGGEWPASHPGHFTPGERFPVPIGQEGGWASEPVWTLWRKEKSLAPVGNLTLAAKPIARRYTD
jgi:hypothetical protein